MFRGQVAGLSLAQQEMQVRCVVRFFRGVNGISERILWHHGLVGVISQPSSIRTLILTDASRVTLRSNIDAAKWTISPRAVVSRLMVAWRETS